MTSAVLLVGSDVWMVWMNTSHGKVSYLMVTFGFCFWNSSNMAWLAALKAGGLVPPDAQLDFVAA